MKRNRQVLICPVCGKRANVSRKLVKTKGGKVYYYVRFYHSPLNIHFAPTDSLYSSFPVAEKKVVQLYSALTGYIVENMGRRKLTYTSLKKEIEKSYDGVLYNEEFNRSLKKATSAGLIERIMLKNRPLYSKIPEVDLKEKLKFGQIAINYTFSGEELIVTTFLEPTNNGLIPIKRIPYFIPYGPLDSLDFLNLKVHDETDEISQQDLFIAFSTALETGLSISLNRNLSNGEKDFIFIKYSMPAPGRSINFLAQALVGSLRITVIAEMGYEARLSRTLVNGVKETEIHFLRHCFYKGNRICFQMELDELLKGENISLKLIERHNFNKR